MFGFKRVFIGSQSDLPYTPWMKAIALGVTVDGYSDNCFRLIRCWGFHQLA